MAEWMIFKNEWNPDFDDLEGLDNSKYDPNFSSESDSEEDSDSEDRCNGINYKNAVFKFEQAPYLTEFDDGYDPNEDPDFEEPYSEDDIDEEFEIDDDACEDTQVCFKGDKLTLGSCNHMCCKVWCLEPIQPSIPENFHQYYIPYDAPMGAFLQHHGRRSGYECTAKECNHPNATGTLVKARASRIFNSHTAAKLKSIANASKIAFLKKVQFKHTVPLTVLIFNVNPGSCYSFELTNSDIYRAVKVTN